MGLNQHYFIISATVGDGGAVEFAIEDSLLGFSSERPVWTGEEWVAVTSDLEADDKTALDALRTALYGHSD